MTSYAIFMAFNSPEFCDAYIRAPLGWVATGVSMGSLSGFMMFWGWVFVGTTVALAFFAREKATPENVPGQEPAPKSLRAAYTRMWQVLRLPNVMGLVLVLVTCKIGFAATDAATSLELVEGGMPQEHLALMGVSYV